MGGYHYEVCRDCVAAPAAVYRRVLELNRRRSFSASASRGSVVSIDPPEQKAGIRDPGLLQPAAPDPSPVLPAPASPAPTSRAPAVIDTAASGLPSPLLLQLMDGFDVSKIDGSGLGRLRLARFVLEGSVARDSREEASVEPARWRVRWSTRRWWRWQPCKKPLWLEQCVLQRGDPVWNAAGQPRLTLTLSSPYREPVVLLCSTLNQRELLVQALLSVGGRMAPSAAGSGAPARVAPPWGMCCVSGAEWTRTKLNMDERCPHLACVECAAGLLEAALERGAFPVYCAWCQQDGRPDVGYLCEDTMRALVAAGVDDALCQRFAQQQLLAAVGADLFSSCPRCSAPGVLPSPSTTRVFCASCRQSYCHQCRSAWHSQQSCLEHRDDDDATQRHVASSSKPCPSCGVRVTKYWGHGCHHIRPGDGCPAVRGGQRCGQHWCFACGRAYLPGRVKSCVCSGSCDAHCGCPPCPTRIRTGDCDEKCRLF